MVYLRDCAASYEKYGTDSAVMIKFANEVSRDIKAWLKDEQHSDRIVRICFSPITRPNRRLQN